MCEGRVGAAFRVIYVCVGVCVCVCKAQCCQRPRLVSEKVKSPVRVRRGVISAAPSCGVVQYCTVKLTFVNYTMNDLFVLRHDTHTQTRKLTHTWKCATQVPQEHAHTHIQILHIHSHSRTQYNHTVIVISSLK